MEMELVKIVNTNIKLHQQKIIVSILKTGRRWKQFTAEIVRKKQENEIKITELCGLEFVTFLYVIKIRKTS